MPAAAREGTADWRVEPFVPQRAVLAHAAVRGFVSHCGANSTHEAIASGVPMLCVPFFCDQYEWAASVVKAAAARRGAFWGTTQQGSRRIPSRLN